MKNENLLPKVIMTTLIKIRNSQGIRIPKPLIPQAHLENVSLELTFMIISLDIHNNCKIMI